MIQEWHVADVEKRQIASRLRLNIKGIRRQIRKIDAGAVAPARTSPSTKLDRYLERIADLATSGQTTWSILVALREDPAFGLSASYERVRASSHTPLRWTHLRTLEHLPGTEMQADFGKLLRVRHRASIDDHYLEPAT